jgi:hypothetical protein
MPTILSPVVEEQIWTFDRPVWFSGVRQRARTTVIRLNDGGLLVHSAAPRTPALEEELRALGPVRFLVVPNAWHHLGAPALAASFPEAKVVGPRSALTRNKDLKLDLDIADPEFLADIPELEAIALEGVPFWDETVLYHRPTRTLLAADIIVCASPADHWTLRWASRLFGFYETARVPPDAKNKIADKASAARSIRAMLERPAERLIVGHADILEGPWQDALGHAWRLEGVDV